MADGGFIVDRKPESRREFFRNSLMGVLGAEFTATWSLARARDPEARGGAEVKGLRILNERPYNAEALPHHLDDQITPFARMFVRNNSTVPVISGVQADQKISIGGSVRKETNLSIGELQRKFPRVVAQMVLECGGNGRAGFSPKVSGNQWTFGAVGCPVWEGIRLRDLLDFVGVKKSAVYIAYYGHDRHLSGDPGKNAISRGIPLQKAKEDWTMIAFSMNGRPLPPEHGYPARLICPGYPGSASGKWLKRLLVRDRVHDGEKMGGYSYRVPEFPVRPGEQVAKEHMKIIHEMPVKSLITFPESGIQFPLSAKVLEPRGFAWSGFGRIIRVDLSYDFGQTWLAASLEDPVNPYAWQRWRGSVRLPRRGYYEVWARATDVTGRQQPMLVPGWNPKGYLNNAMPRIAVQAV